MDNAIIEAAVVKAVFDSLGPEERDAMLQKALEHVFERPAKRYSSDPDIPSPLEQVFKNIVHEAMTKAVRQHLELSPAFQEQLKQMVAEAVGKVMAEKTQMSEAVGTAITEVLRKVW